ncbi:putative glycosyltransferase EpsJ [Companilactobacillus paralimentarius]|uniref:glycosyltransferase family 2 protein n=1 Tax=Companilactobacillus paralimentarius TaxID=83526 RepID=UPI00384DA099
MIKMKITLSIIIPMYNTEQTIGRCLDSIERQQVDFPFEIIVVDDGSTDDSVGSIETYQKRFTNIKLFKQQNMKQSAARNNGLNHAKGDYVMFFDSDDIIENGMLSIMVHKIEADNDLVMCGIKKIYPDKTVVEDQTDLTSAKNEQDLITKYLDKNKEFDTGLWNKIFRRSLIQGHQLRFNNGNFFEDSLFNLRYLLNCRPGKVVFINRTLYDLCKTSGTTTTSFNPKISYWASKYENKVQAILNSRGLHVKTAIINAFKIRTTLYIIHHHIKYDTSWNKAKQRRYWSLYSISAILKALQYLPRRYAAAVILARFSPQTYIRLYQKKNPVT